MKTKTHALNLCTCHTVWCVLLISTLLSWFGMIKWMSKSLILLISTFCWSDILFIALFCGLIVVKKSHWCNIISDYTWSTQTNTTFTHDFLHCRILFLTTNRWQKFKIEMSSQCFANESQRILHHHHSLSSIQRLVGSHRRAVTSVRIDRLSPVLIVCGTEDRYATVQVTVNIH